MKNDFFLEVRLPSKCTVFLTTGEINRLLLKDPALFQQAIRRGKWIIRARKEQARREKAGGHDGF